MITKEHNEVLILKERIKELESQLSEKCPDVWDMQIQNRNIVHENLDLKAERDSLKNANRVIHESHKVIADENTTLIKQRDRLREALLGLNAAIDFHWNTTIAVGQRMPDNHANKIINAQQIAKKALEES